MVRIGFLKMLRDMKRSLSAYLICIFIVTIGFVGYNLMLVTRTEMGEAKDMFFEQCNYCDGFAEVVSAPATVARELEKIPGVLSVQGRIVQKIPVEEMGSDDIHLKVISQTIDGMNRVYLENGRNPAAGQDEIVVGTGFYGAHDLQPGEKITISPQGTNRQMTIVGHGVSPESMYLVQNLAEMLPALDKYDAAFVDIQTAEKIWGHKGEVNQFLFRMKPGADFEDIKEEVEDVLDPYGVTSTYDGEDEVSVAIFQQELDQMEQMSAYIPVLFLGVAAVILYILLNRLLGQQRTQIGTLMALGVRPRLIRLHYVGYGLTVGLIGGCVGGILGNYSAAPLTDYYKVFYQIPDVTKGFYVQYVIQGMVMAGGFCSLISYICTGMVKKQTPAGALRPEAPKTSRRFFMEIIPGFTRMFTVPGIMGVRSLARHRRRTVLSLCGVACAYMITATLVSMSSLFDIFIFSELEENQQQDITVNFTELIKEEDALEILSNSRMQKMEGVLEVGAQLKSRKDDLDVTISVIDRDAQLTRLYDAEGNAVYTRQEGIVLSEFMASRLGLQKGDHVTLKMTWPEEKEYEIPVTDLMAQYIGTTAYMSKEAMGDLTPYHDVISSIKCKAPEDVREELKQQVEDSPYEGIIETRQEKIDQYRSMMGSMNMILFSMAFLGVIVGIAVIYTSSLIYYEELKREISTLMMLGMRSRECLDVISVGQYLLACGGILLGIPMTMWASRVISTGMASEMFTIPDFVDGKALVASVFLIFLSVWFSSRLILGKMKKLVPVEMLRERE